MTLNQRTTTSEADVAHDRGEAAAGRRKISHILGLDRFSGLYVWALLILIFAYARALGTEDVLEVAAR